MKHFSLFSGIGGAELAAEWAGWENVAHCEINPFCRKILNYYWPHATTYEDITTTDFTLWRGRVDVLTGGFPCQPYSVAGKRKGKEDERHLWPEMLRAIREIQPRWVVGENVRGLINWNGGLVFDEVQADLEAEGYEVIPFLLPACGVDAPHRRDRIWFVAYADKFRCGNEQKENRLPIQNGNGDIAPTKQKRWQQQCRACKPNWAAADASIVGLQQSGNTRKWRPRPSDNDSGIIANTNGIGLRGESNRIGESRFLNEEGKVYDWQNFPTQPPVCSRDDELSDRLDGTTFSKWRNESLKGFGNAWVPKAALQIFKAINEYEKIRSCKNSNKE
jgi:DNA (cytosine-5)-methyltransferase 1